MQRYNTVEEKAGEWNLSARHIQFLCRSGSIEGAVKHAGVWCIPKEAPSPAKYERFAAGSVENGYDYTGTKKKLLLAAIELFAQNGFDSVSLRELADKVGIRQSTIYNHFGSKQEILEEIYGFYRHHYLKDRPSLAQMKRKLESDSLLQIIAAIRYDFEQDYLQIMADITKIILQRVGMDNNAREIAISLMLEEGIQYVEAVFNMGVEEGRFAPFNTRAFSVLMNSVRIFTLYCWIADPSPDSMSRLLEDEQTLYRLASELITDRLED